MTNSDDRAGPERMPGLFRSWELGLVLRPGRDYRIEAAGETRDGAPLIAIFRTAHSAERLSRAADPEGA